MDVKIKLDHKLYELNDYYQQDSFKTEKLTSIVHALITQLNEGYDFGKEVAEEWVKYLVKFVSGYGSALINPYSDLKNYELQSFSMKSEDLGNITSIRILDNLPSEVLKPTDQADVEILQRTLFVLALGGMDTTFYKGLSNEAGEHFAKGIYSPELYECFKKYNVVNLIPRGFATKKDDQGDYTTNVESMILQAYHAGIKHVAIIANAKTYRAIEDFLEKRLNPIEDLKIVVTVQPILPRIRTKKNSNELVISTDNDGYPGGHGHGFKYCLRDIKVRRLIQKNELEYFIFSNGDNAVLFNWGAEHFVWSIKQMEMLTENPEYSKLRMALFLVWEYLRKGGFSFLLTHKTSRNQMPQIFEAELAGKSGADIESLKHNKGGYNTNVATGITKNVYEHLDNLPMTLKKKHQNGQTDYLFEASFATAMTTHQNDDASSVFDPNTVINILGPNNAKYQQWNHIAIRKRDDLFAFHSSLFKLKKIKTQFGKFLTIVTDRVADKNFPILKGNFVDPNILNTKEFFEIFIDSHINIDQFFGTLHIDLLVEKEKPRGKIKFEGDIKLNGSEEITVTVPAGECWIIKDKEFNADKAISIISEEITVTYWDSILNRYI